MALISSREIIIFIIILVDLDLQTRKITDMCIDFTVFIISHVLAWRKLERRRLLGAFLYVTYLHGYNLKAWLTKKKPPPAARVLYRDTKSRTRQGGSDHSAKYSHTSPELHNMGCVIGVIVIFLRA